LFFLWGLSDFLSLVSFRDWIQIIGFYRCPSKVQIIESCLFLSFFLFCAQASWSRSEL
jgi:hypothetical protein